MSTTPTTDDVKIRYSLFASEEDPFEAEEAFNAWLAGVKADAWEEGWGNGNVYGMTRSGGKKANFDNPYRQGEEHTHTKRSSFGDPYCKTCGIDLEGETE